MLIDEFVQYWGHAEGLPGLRVGMTLGEAQAAIEAAHGCRVLGGDLSFAVGDLLQTRPPVALHGGFRVWREITFRAAIRSDDDGGFWAAAALVAEYLAGEFGAPRPLAHVGRRGQKQLRVRHRGLADGTPAELRFFADGQTEDGLSMEVSILPERPWSEILGDSLGIGPALSDLLHNEGPWLIPPGAMKAIPAELDGSQVEAHRTTDGSLRLRVSAGPSSGTTRRLASSTAPSDLLNRLSPKHQTIEGLGHWCEVFRGLPGPAGPLEIRLSRRPTPQIETELLIKKG